MANKQLTAKVRLNTTQAEQKLKRIAKAIDAINRAAGKQSSAYNQVNSALGKTVKTSEKVRSKTDQTTKSTRQWSNAVDGVNKKLNTSSKHVGMISGKLKGLVNTYLGVMGMGAIISTSDMITSAENKLNYVSAQQLGSSGTNADGSYSKATLNATQDAMDKMYASSQKVRMGYGDMMSNVSKSMALAGDAFNHNTDMAIRFQEVMAEAYAVGGASAQEMSSSMYQLIQALGSGILAGDELRSVREGAPLAYKAIEEFAQGVYGADKSLKDMASQGMITADIVTAAIMSAGDEMDKAFAQTEQTFSQTWTQIKNVAIRAFKPISEQLREALNDAIDSGLIQKVETVFANIAKVILIVFKVVGTVVSWIGDNWGWISKLLLSVAAILGGVLLGALILNLMTVGGLIKKFVLLGIQAVKSAIKSAISWLTLSLPLTIIIALLVAVIVTLIWVSDSFVDACGIVVGSLYWLWAVFKNIFIWMFKVAAGLWESIKAIGTNIGIAFSNAWNSAKAAFWGFIADCLDGLKGLEPVINKIAEAFGKEGFTLSSVIDYASAKADAYTPKEYVSVGDAWKTGYNSFEYNNLSDAYAEGYAIGSEWGQSVTDKLKELKDKLGSGLTFPTEGVDPSKLLGNIDDNTGKMADSMDLTAEDVEYLRKIAAMEWKKEYTVADIKVDMSNYNTINGDSDLDGIVTKLSEKLYEELNEVANGVYAY